MKELSILILAGGKSKRFGKEKALFRIDNKPMLRHVIDRISKLSEEIVVSCMLDLGNAFPGVKIVLDKKGKKGALRGLVSALPEIESEYVSVVTCDCPRIKPEVIEILFENAKGHDGAVPIWPNGYLEPLQAVYKTGELRKAAKKVWEKGKMKIADVLKELDVVYVSVERLKKVDPELKSFFNVNSPDMLEKLPKL